MNSRRFSNQAYNFSYNTIPYKKTHSYHENRNRHYIAELHVLLDIHQNLISINFEGELNRTDFEGELKAIYEGELNIKFDEILGVT